MAKKRHRQRAGEVRGRRTPTEAAVKEFVVDGDPDWRAYMPEADELPAASTAEAQRILEVRAGFMEALVHDPRVVALFQGWVDQAQQSARAAAGAVPPELVFDDIMPLVEVELGLRWPWVAIELLHTFHRMIELQIADPARALPPAGAVGVLAPQFKFDFAVEDGESTAEVRAKLALLVSEVLALLRKVEAEADAGPPHKAPRKDTGYLRTRGRWFYEMRVRRPPAKITPLAAEYHATQGHPGRFVDHDCRKQIRDGLREAERLLALNSYIFRVTRENKTPPRGR